MGNFAKIATAFLGLLAVEAIATPTPHHGGPGKKCKHPTQRKAWHTLSNGQKRAYLDAELCVMSTPGSLGLPGALSKYDELVSNHQIQARLMHGTGVFLPYHRYLLHAHGELLRQCGYHGGLPYWDETLDAGDIYGSDLFAPGDLSFGGDGEGPDGCLLSGPFAGQMAHVGPGFNVSTRCVYRHFDNGATFLATQAEVDACDAFQTYEDAWMCFYWNPHFAGHGGVGGIMADPLVSPSDPIFYLHHGFVDKIWWDWQMANTSSRLYDISGPNVQDPEVGFPEFPGGVEEEGAIWGFPSEEMLALMPTGKEGDNGDVTTLDHIMSSLGVIPDVTIREVMDTREDYLCYEYV